MISNAHAEAAGGDPDVRQVLDLHHDQINTGHPRLPHAHTPATPRLPSPPMTVPATPAMRGR